MEIMNFIDVIIKNNLSNFFRRKIQIKCHYTKIILLPKHFVLKIFDFHLMEIINLSNRHT